MKTERHSIGKHVSLLHRQKLVFINNALKDTDITSAEYVFLAFLCYQDDGMNQKDISRELFIDKAATSRALKSLESKGYLNREKDQLDKRINRINITEKTRGICSRLYNTLDEWDYFISEGIDDETLELVYNTLKKMSYRSAEVQRKYLNID